MTAPKKRALAKREPEVIDAPPIKPWDQQEHETARQYAAFCAYRDMSPHVRSVETAANSHGRSLSTWGPIATAKRWVARAALWDAEQDRVRREAMLKATHDQALKRVQGFDDAYNFGHTALMRAKAKLDEDIEAIGVSPGSAVEIMERSAKAGRIERGEPGDVTHHSVTPNAAAPVGLGGIDYSKLTPDELAALRTLLAKATRV